MLSSDKKVLIDIHTKKSIRVSKEDDYKLLIFEQKDCKTRWFFRETINPSNIFSIKVVDENDIPLDYQSLSFTGNGIEVLFSECETGTLTLLVSPKESYIEIVENDAPPPSVTPSVTPTITPSITPSVSPSVTPSITPSVTSSITPTPSITPSVTPSLTPSVTPTNSPSPTPSVTPSVTSSVTPSVTPSSSVTPSITPSVTPTSSVTPTPSVTPSTEVIEPLQDSDGLDLYDSDGNQLFVDRDL